MNLLLYYRLTPRKRRVEELVNYKGKKKLNVKSDKGKAKKKKCSIEEHSARFLAESIVFKHLKLEMDTRKIGNRIKVKSVDQNWESYIRSNYYLLYYYRCPKPKAITDSDASLPSGFKMYIRIYSHITYLICLIFLFLNRSLQMEKPMEISHPNGWRKSTRLEGKNKLRNGT